MNLVDRVNQYLVNPHLDENRGRTAFYPSEASVISQAGDVIGKCRRAVWYSWTDTPITNPIDARGRWTLDFGKEIERMYTERFKEIGIWAANNVKYYDPDHNISGEADIFVFNGTESGSIGEPSGMIDGVEIKTAYGYGFQKNIANAPKPENLMQVMLYLDWFSKKFDINEWHLIYHSRDTMENIEYEIELQFGDSDNKTYPVINGIPYKLFDLESIYARYSELGMFILNNEIPPRDYTYAFPIEQSEQRLKDGKISKTRFAQVKSGKYTDSDWQCLYCPYLEHCWEDKRKEILNGSIPTGNVETDI